METRKNDGGRLTPDHLQRHLAALWHVFIGNRAGTRRLPNWKGYVASLGCIGPL